ncbi:MAG: hypothetical protein AB7O97_05880 [Planctomycetota bacterium]
MRRILTGDLDPADPAVRSMIEQRPDLQQQIDEMLATQRRVADAARLEREVLAEAGVHGGAAGGSASRAPRPFPRWFPLAAAAVVLVAGTLWVRGLFESNGNDGQDTMLNSDSGPKIEALERTDAGLLVRWSGAIEPEHYYRVTLRDPDSGVELARSIEPLRGTEWLIEPVPARLPESVRVELEVRSPTDRVSVRRRDLPAPRSR